MIIPPFSGEGLCSSSSYCRRPFDYVMFNNVATILEQKYTLSVFDFDLDGVAITQDYIDNIREAKIQIIFATEKHADTVVQKYIDLATCTSLIIGPGSKNIKDNTVFRIIGEPEYTILSTVDSILSEADDKSYQTVFCNILPLSDIAFTLALKDSGCKYVFIGIESANDSILKEMRKSHNFLDAKKAVENLHSAGIQFGIGFLPFNPYSTAQTLLKDMYFLKSITSSNLSHPWNICCFMNVCIMDDPYLFDIQVSNIYIHFQKVFDEMVLPQVTSWEKELRIFPERYRAIVPQFEREALFDCLTQICTEHIYKNARIKLVCKNDAEFLNVLMNCTTVLQILNEVPTELQDWIDAINEWSHDDDEEDYIVFDENTPIGWLGVNGLLDENKKAYLKMAVFLPDYQGQGFGSFAIQEVMCHLRHRGIQQLILYTDKDNYRAQACYKKCGFRIVESLVETMSNGKDVPRVKMETHWE